MAFNFIETMYCQKYRTIIFNLSFSINQHRGKNLEGSRRDMNVKNLNQFAFEARFPISHTMSSISRRCLFITIAQKLRF